MRHFCSIGLSDRGEFGVREHNYSLASSEKNPPKSETYMTAAKLLQYLNFHCRILHSFSFDQIFLVLRGKCLYQWFPPISANVMWSSTTLILTWTRHFILTFNVVNVGWRAISFGDKAKLGTVWATVSRACLLQSDLCFSYFGFCKQATEIKRCRQA